MFGAPFKRWMTRHVAMAPKGFLRFYVLKLLSEKPLSGSEIMDEIEKRTEGCWRPSPGSVYPLITWLEEKKYIKEVPTGEAGIRRYALTEQGKTFLDEHLERFKAFSPFWLSPFGPRWIELYPETAKGFSEAIKHLATAIWKFRIGLREKYSEKAVSEAKETLQQAAKKLEEIAERLKGE